MNLHIFFFSFSRVKFLNVSVGEGDAVMSIDVLESCSAGEMFSDCRRNSEVEDLVASTCEWAQSEWGRRSGEFILSNSCKLRNFTKILDIRYDLDPKEYRVDQRLVPPDV